MPSVYDLKPKFQNLLRPLVKRLADRGITANQVTVFAVVISIAGGAAIAMFPDTIWPLLLLPVVLLVRMALNAIDGMLAREFGQKSQLGAILNELGDVISDVGLYLPLALIPGVHQWPVILFVISAVIVEFAGVLAVQVGTDRRYDGPMGKSDRAFWIGLFSVLLALGVLRPEWSGYWFGTMTVLSFWSIFNRSRRALASGN